MDKLLQIGKILETGRNTFARTSTIEFKILHRAGIYIDHQMANMGQYYYYTSQQHQVWGGTGIRTRDPLWLKVIGAMNELG